MANNNEELSVAQVFGEKSKDGDELVAHTLQSIANMPRGEGEDILYRILKESGDTTYIHQYLKGLPTKERREWGGNILRGDVADPTFADTLSYEAGMERLAPRKGFLQQLMEYMGK